MLIIVAGSRWAGNAGRAAGWRAGTFGCGDANQAGGEGEEEREERGEGEFTWTRNLQANERRADGCQPREMRSQNSFILLCGYCRGRERRKGGIRGE